MKKWKKHFVMELILSKNFVKNSPKVWSVASTTYNCHNPS